MTFHVFWEKFFENRYIQKNLEYLIDRNYDSSENSNLSIHVVADILNLLFLHDFLDIFSCIVDAKIW